MPLSCTPRLGWSFVGSVAFAIGLGHLSLVAPKYFVYTWKIYLFRPLNTVTFYWEGAYAGRYMPHLAKIKIFLASPEWDIKLTIVARTGLVCLSWSTEKCFVFRGVLAGHCCYGNLLCLQK